MMNLADPMFLIILPFPLMSSRTEKSLKLCSSLSLCHSAGFFFSKLFSIFSCCLAATSSLPLFVPWWFLHELLCHYFSKCFTYRCHTFSSSTSSVSLFSLIPFFSGSHEKQQVFKESFVPQLYSRILSQLFFPATWFISNRLFLTWSPIWQCEAGWCCSANLQTCAVKLLK